MTWGGQLKAAGVLLLVGAGLFAGLAATFGLVPAEPPAAVALVGTALIAIKAGVAIAGAGAFGGRVREAG